MALNYIWIAFFLVAFLVALGKTLFFGDFSIWSSIMSASFSSAATAFEISLGLTGILSLWMGLMKIGERGGVIQFFGRMISPLFCRLFPGIPKGHPAMGSIFMNVSANMLGLDNAGRSRLRPVHHYAYGYEAQTGSIEYQKQAWLGGLALLVGGIVWFFSSLPKEEVELYSSFVANVLLFSVIIMFICAGLKKRINMYDAFIEGAKVNDCISCMALRPRGVAALSRPSMLADTFINIDPMAEGAKEGFKTAVMIIPYLVAILVAIGMFRASGAMDVVTDAIASCFSFVGLDAEWVGALPTALMKPLSGSGSRGMMVDLMNTYGPDAFVSRHQYCKAKKSGEKQVSGYDTGKRAHGIGKQRIRHSVAGLDNPHAAKVNRKDVECRIGA